MRIQRKVERKVVSQLLLTPDEVVQLFEMVQEAKDGKTVHYSERRQPNGSFFGVGIDPAYAENVPVRQPDMAERQGPVKY